jgi:hypothetical protein
MCDAALARFELTRQPIRRGFAGHHHRLSVGDNFRRLLGETFGSNEHRRGK